MMPLRTCFLMSLLACLLFYCKAPAQEPAGSAAKPEAKAEKTEKAPPQKDRRRVFIMHSGVHTILANPNKNIAAASLKEGLLQRGISAKDIVVLDNPYPTATWRNMFPVECLTMFAESSMPESKVSQEAYVRLHKALQAQGVTREDELVWIGHSAGGQMGLTMAHIAKNLDKHPDLLKTTIPYQFDMVILLGSPIAANLLAPEIKLRHYFSPQDRVVRQVVKYGPALIWAFGYRLAVTTMPPNLDGNDKVRVFTKVEHPYWDVDKRVLDRILSETRPGYQPLWCSPVLNPGLDMALMRLVSGAVEERFLVTFEEPPWK
jgi:hypothetical protein